MTFTNNLFPPDWKETVFIFLVLIVCSSLLILFIEKHILGVDIIDLIKTI